MDCKRIIVAMIAVLLTVGAGWAQETTPEKSTSGEEPNSEQEVVPQRSEEDLIRRIESRKNRPKRTWEQFIAEWLTAKPYPKSQVVRIDEYYAFPHVAASIKMEIVREDDKGVWLRGIPPEDPQSPLYKVWSQRQVNEARMVQAAEAIETPGAIFFLDFQAEPVPPGFQKSLNFLEPDGILPETGRWQMNFDVADMNEDGHLDIVFPPRRQTYPPEFAIFTGSGDGNFTLWSGLRWPASLHIDYGGVAVADMDGDGHQDIISAIHFGPQFIFYGDGTGDFTRSERLPLHDPRLSSRAVAVGDFDDDGKNDLAFVAEIDYDMKANEKIEGRPRSGCCTGAAKGGKWCPRPFRTPTSVI